jgi:hypothetical protein
LRGHRFAHSCRVPPPPRRCGLQPTQADLAKAKGKEGDPVKRREADAAALQAKVAAKAAAAATAPK